MFRDPHIAAQEKEIARLRDELHQAKSKDELTARKLKEAEEKLQRKEKRKKRFNPERWHFPRLGRIHWGVIAILTLLIGWNIFHYFGDIQEGVVTGKEYHREVTTCDGDGICSTIPEHWTVDIAYQGQTATWRITREEYGTLRRGQWYCYVDEFHSRGTCDGPEN